MYIPPAIVTDGLAVVSVFPRGKGRLDAALKAFFKKAGKYEIRKAYNTYVVCRKGFHAVTMKVVTHP